MSRAGPRALVIHPDARIAIVDAPHGDTAMLNWLQTTVGGYIECVHPAADPPVSDWHAYINEDGKGGENLIALALAQAAGWLVDSMLYGPAVFLGHDGEDEADVPQELIDLGIETGLLTGLGGGDG